MFLLGSPLMASQARYLLAKRRSLSFLRREQAHFHFDYDLAMRPVDENGKVLW